MASTATGAHSKRKSSPGSEVQFAPQTPAEQLWFTTTRIGAQGTNESQIATGFFYLAQTDDSPLPLVVTTKHVLERVDSISLHFLSATPNGEWQIGTQMEHRLEFTTTSFWTGHPDTTVDIAVLGVDEAFGAMVTDSARPFLRALTRDLFATPSDYKAWDAVQQVTFVGYPAGLYDKYHGTPIIRQGITATMMSLDYEGMPAYMIDAKVFPGSSGSPVFVGGTGFERLKEGWELGNSSFKFAGLLASVQQYSERAMLTSGSDPLGVTTTQYLDLGIVFRADAVLDTIDAFLADRGMEENPVATPLPLGRGR